MRKGDMVFNHPTPPLGTFQPLPQPSINHIQQLQRPLPSTNSPNPVHFLPNSLATPPPPQQQLSANSMPSAPACIHPANLHQNLFGTVSDTPQQLQVQPQQLHPHPPNLSPIATVPSINTLSLTPNSIPATSPPPQGPLPAIPHKSTRTESIKARERKLAIAERTKKSAATRKRNRAAKQLQAQSQGADMIKSLHNASRGGASTVGETIDLDIDSDIGGFKVGDKVICRPSDSLGQEAAEVVLVNGDNLYVHFEGRDRRMDRWISRNEVRAARKNAHNTHEYASASQVKLTRSRYRQLQERNPVSEKETGNEAVARAEKEREERTKVKNVAKLVFGSYQLDAWYFSPFPIAKPSASSVNNNDNNNCTTTLDCVYMCQYCMIYGKSLSGYAKHKKKCAWTRPPGYRIYHDSSKKVSVYEIDGMVNVGYCQRLTLLGKLFLDHKTLFFDVSPFLFYVVTIGDEVGGFFSKEKPERKSEFNLACILTLPHHQKKGLGRFLIELSYTLSRIEGKIGSPERPLSDLGQVSYRSFWVHEVLKYAKSTKKNGQLEVPVDVVAEETGIRVQDVTEVLKSLNMLKIWKGDHSMNLQNSNNLEKQWRLSKEGRIPVRKRFLKHPNKATVARDTTGHKQSSTTNVNISSSIKKKRNGKAASVLHGQSLNLNPDIHKRAGSSTASLSASGKKRRRPPKSDIGSLSPSASRRGFRQRIETPRTPNALAYADIPRFQQNKSMYNVNGNGNGHMRKYYPQYPLHASPPSTPATPRPQQRTEPDFMDQTFDAALVSFCNTHTPEKVLLPHNHPDGIPKTTIIVFAKSVNRPPALVEKHLRSKASDIIVGRHLPPVSKPKPKPAGLYNNISINNNCNDKAVKRPGAKDVHLVAKALNSAPEKHGEILPSVGSPRKSPLRSKKANGSGAKDAQVASDIPSTQGKRVSGIIRKAVNSPHRDGSRMGTASGPERPDIKGEPRIRNAPSVGIDVIDLISDDEDVGNGRNNGNGNGNLLCNGEVSSLAKTPTTSTSTANVGSTSSSLSIPSATAPISNVQVDRTNLIEECILLVMKQRQLVSYPKLLLEVSRLCKPDFEPDERQVLNRIEALINRESIEKQASNVYKYVNI